MSDNFTHLFTPAPREDLSDLFGASEHPNIAEAFTDGGCRGNPGPAGYGVVIRWRGAVTTLKGVIGVATNNEAEYQGLLACLRWARDHQVPHICIYSDSELVVRQLQGRYGVSTKLRPLYLQACGLIRGLGTVTLTHVPRERNTVADKLANEAMDAAGYPRQRTWPRP